MDRLIVIESKHWPELRDLYKTDWPKHVLSHSLIDMFIDWDRDYNGKSFAKIYSFDENWRNHGTYMLTSVNYACCESLDNSNKNLIKLLKLIDFQEVKRTAPFDFLITHASDLPDELGLKMYKPALEFLMENEDIMAVDLECPADMELKRLTEKDVEEVNKYWEYGTELSLAMNKLCIERLPSVGLFKKSGELVGWIMTEYGYVGHAGYVHPQYRREGYSKLLINELFKNLKQDGKNYLDYVAADNRIMLAVRRDFYQKINDIKYWYTIAPKSKL